MNNPNILNFGLAAAWRIVVVGLVGSCFACSAMAQPQILAVPNGQGEVPLPQKVAKVRPNAEAVPNPGPPKEFWRNAREGWFWYREPPAPPPDDVQPVAPASAQAAAPTDAPTMKKMPKNKDIIEFETFQHNLEESRKVAINNPTVENARIYAAYEQAAMQQVVRFAAVQQALKWTDPVFAAQRAGDRPVNPAAMDTWDNQQVSLKADMMKDLAATHGLYFFMRGDCAYCRLVAPVVKDLSKKTGLAVFPVTLDGGSDPEYPNPSKDNGIAKRLGINTVPALVLAEPKTGRLQIVSFGVVSQADIVDRIFMLTRQPDGPAAELSRSQALQMSGPLPIPKE